MTTPRKKKLVNTPMTKQQVLLPCYNGHYKGNQTILGWKKREGLCIFKVLGKFDLRNTKVTKYKKVRTYPCFSSRLLLTTNRRTPINRILNRAPIDVALYRVWVVRVNTIRTYAKIRFEFAFLMTINKFVDATFIRTRRLTSGVLYFCISHPSERNLVTSRLKLNAF